MKYKLIVLDLDGTLTNSKKEITLRNKEALIRVQEQGVRLVLASGRPSSADSSCPITEEKSSTGKRMK